MGFVKNKKAIEFSFAWIFAILVGATIIFLAIYAASRFIVNERNTIDSEIGKKIEILLNPLGTGLESGKLNKIELGSEARIFNTCKDIGNFGVQEISVATKSGLGKSGFGSPGAPSSFYDKYLFSESFVQGKSFYLFSKPFEFPFKIADLIFIWPADKKYCFVNPPREIEEEMRALNPLGINFSYSEDECDEKSTKVCFGKSGCDVDVDIDSESVLKNEERIYYSGALVYGAIFSDVKLYECQVKRVMKRASEIALLYVSESQYLSGKGCSSNLDNLLIDYANKARIGDSSGIKSVESVKKEVENRNEALSCKLF